MILSTEEKSDSIGRIWVGPSPKVIDYRGHPGKKIYISQDGLKQYRESTIKKSSGKSQANLQRRESISDGWEHNGHIQISE